MPFAVLASAFVALAAAPARAAPPPPPAPITDWRALDPANTLVVETSKGLVVIEMRPELAPRHVARVKTLARQGYYNGGPFFRVIKGFMAQAGGRPPNQLRSALPMMQPEFEFAKTAAPYYAGLAPSPAGEMGFVGTLPVVIDPDGAKGFVKFCPGIASHAHGATDNTSNSQFFLMRGRANTLERGFTAWGRVVVGRDVVDAIKDGEPVVQPDTIVRIRVLTDIPAAQRPPVPEVMDTRGPAFAQVFADTLKARGDGFSLCDVEVPTRTPQTAP
jgi:peptidylprolyl isomerase